MIYHSDKNENPQNLFSETIRELQLGRLLRRSNLTKSFGIPAYEVFQFLLLLVFQGKICFVFLIPNTRRFKEYLLSLSQ